MAPPNGKLPADDDDIDYTDIEEKFQVELEEGFDNIVVVDGIPTVDQAKKEKLLAKMCKDFSKRGAPIKAENVFMPWDNAKGKSKGFAFMEFDTREEAKVAIAAMHGFPFDAKHTFFVNEFTDIEKLQDFDETYHEPPQEEFQSKEHLRAWLADPQGRDQYVTFRGEEVTIHWHGKPSQSEPDTKRTNWADFYVQWSPLGTTLATLHRQGIRLWGGLSWNAVQRFPHPSAVLLDFSPNERYIVSYSIAPIVVRENLPFTDEDVGNNIAVWDVKTGELLRTFPTTVQQLPEGENREGRKTQIPWPTLKWSSEDKYVARVTPGQQISIYELPSMGLLDKKSIKIDGVVDVEWCPHGEQERDDEGKSETKKKARDNMLAYWTPEVQDQPARVSLMSIPSRTVLRTKNLYNVTDCKLYWQNQGDFLCVKVDRHTKTKKSIFCNLEIFRVREKDFPVEVVELKDTVTHFSWEPHGDRFAIISSNDPNLGATQASILVRTDLSFYQLDRAKGVFKLLKELPNRSSNAVRWSPRGRHVVLATVGNASKSDVEFWDLDFYADDYSSKKDPSKEEWGAGIQQIGAGEFYGMTDLEWDPSGRYLATSASEWRQHQPECGYAIWDFRGQEIEKYTLERFFQLIWRPRPRTLLSKEQQKKVRRTLKEYSRVFEEDDAAEESNVSAELIAQRKRLVDTWNEWRLRCEETYDGRKMKVAAPVEVEEREEIGIEKDELIGEPIVEFIDE